MISISLCMIVKNEQEVLRRCLESFKSVVDEIIIVDTGSNDNTICIAKEYTDKVYNFNWVDDFSKARNYSFSKATKDYILWIDADELIYEEDLNKFIDLKNNLESNYDTVTMITNMSTDNKDGLMFKRHRLVKKSKDYKWVGFIHEYIDVSGITYDSDIKIYHQKIKSSGNRNLGIYKDRLEKGEKLSTRDICYYGKELYYNGYYNECLKLLNEFLEIGGWAEDEVDAICKIAECHMLNQEYHKAREKLFKAFDILDPRAEVIYRIALTYQLTNKYKEAIYWYESILNLNKPLDSYGFITSDYWDLFPHINLCICYFKLGDIQKALYHHNESMKIDSDNQYVVMNEDFFSSIYEK